MTLATARSTTTTDGLVGTAIVYDQAARIRTPFGPFDEMISPRALRGVLGSPAVDEVALLRDHVTSLLLARVGAGTLTLINSPTGLDIRATPVASPLGAETIELVRRRDLRGMSFAFTVAGDSWHDQDSKIPLRVVEEIGELIDVSIVTYPAYRGTVIGIATPAARHHQNRLRMAAHRMPGGLRGGNYGTRTFPPAELRNWCARRPYRRGREALASL